MKYLPALILTEAMYAPVEEIIQRLFNRWLFIPLRAALEENGIEIQNAKSLGVERAIVEGTIYVSEGRFYGKFNASISKELKGMGATYDKRTSSWKLPENAALPARLQFAVAEAQGREQKAISGVIHALDNIDLVDTRSEEEIKEQYGKALWRINEHFVAATQAIAIAPEFTEHSKNVIAQEWATNLNLYIKNWAAEEILELRQKVQANTLRGQRSTNLVKMIQEAQGVSKTKAKFLARQETSLLVSKMREERYKDIGIQRYKWTGTDDARERPDHKVLNGNIYTWDQPPITNRKTGARNNPGEDFGCRCIAVPILEGAEHG